MSQRIAIIIPTFNSGALLHETLATVSAQTRHPDEVLIVDDGSRDATPELARAWGARQAFPVRVLVNAKAHHPLGGAGPAAARQTALEATDADLVALLDHDDLLLPAHLETLESAFMAIPTLVLCFADALEFYDDAEPGRSFMKGKAIDRVPFSTVTSSTLRVLDEGILEALLPGSFIPTASNLFRRTAALSAGGFDPEAGSADDALLWLRLVRNGPSAYYPAPLARRRVNGLNLSHQQGNLRGAWNAYDAIRLLVEQPQFAPLSDANRVACFRRMKELSEELLYQGSLHGTQSLTEVAGRLRMVGRIGLRHRLRALREDVRGWVGARRA